MTQRPFFTIAIPSKNRVDRLQQAVRSVLQQTFQDFELIVCDNSDAADAAATAAVVRGFDDPRVVYVRTNGRLSMPDNWERAVAEARGEYVGILTDRSVFLPQALERAHREIAATGAPVVTWFGDSYGRGPTGRDFRCRARSGRSWLVESRRLLDYFLHGHPKLASKRIPKLMTAVCSRDVIEAVRASPVGRICPPVCPDYTSGYLMLAYTTRVVLVDEALFISCGTGNGSSFRRRGALADRFMRDLGMSWQALVDRMPTPACFSSALVLNDLLRLRECLPERFAGCEIDRVQYYLGCLADYERAARRGAELFEDYDALMEGLNLEPADVQAAVRTRNVYVRAASMLPPDVADQRQQLDPDDDEDGAFPEFDTVFGAMAWAASNAATPYEPAATTNAPIPMPELRQVTPAIIKPKRRPLSTPAQVRRAGLR